MSKYVFFAKYTPEGLAAIHKDSYASRVSINEKLAASLGGTMECLYYMEGGDFNFMMIVDVPADVPFGIVARGQASGFYERIECRRLLSAEEADRSIGNQGDWVAPGQAS